MDGIAAYPSSTELEENNYYTRCAEFREISQNKNHFERKKTNSFQKLRAKDNSPYGNLILSMIN